MGRSAKIRHRRRRRAGLSGALAEMLAQRRAHEERLAPERWARDQERREHARLNKPRTALGGRSLADVARRAEAIALTKRMPVQR
jgi:hypothetical protein